MATTQTRNLHKNTIGTQLVNKSYMWTLPDHPGPSRKCGPTPALPGVRQNLLDVKIQKKEKKKKKLTKWHLTLKHHIEKAIKSFSDDMQWEFIISYLFL